MRRAAVAGILAALLVIPGPVGAEAVNPCVGRLSQPADGTTVISTQGAKFGQGYAEKRPARLVGVGPRGEIEWVYHAGRDQGIVWAYDIDPMPSGDLFVTATKRQRTLFFVLDPTTGRVVWSEQLDLVDTHDADLLDEHRILIANMRNYDPDTGINKDRLVIYNRTSGEYGWEWRFDGRFPRDGGGTYSDDWTHVNDVDRIGPGRYLASVRNFDQVIVVDRETGAIVNRLGRDDRSSVLKEQHNPQYLETADGQATVLVADSENDRVVEYERGALGWTRTWELGDAETLAWPRDADRLPTGNTLVTDSANNRVIEVTPDGEIVWEFSAPWLVYDAERMAHGDEAGGPTIREQGMVGAYELIDGEPPSMAAQSACAAVLRNWTRASAERTETSTLTPTARPTTGSPTTEEQRADTPTADPESTATTAPGQPGFGWLPAGVGVVLGIVWLRQRV